MKENDEELIVYKEEVPLVESEEVPGTAIDGTTNVEEEKPLITVDESYFILPNQSPDKDKSDKDKSDSKPDKGDKGDKSDEEDKSDQDGEEEDGDGEGEDEETDAQPREGEDQPGQGEPYDYDDGEPENASEDPFEDADGDGKPIPTLVNHELRDDASEFVKVNRKDRDFFR